MVSVDIKILSHGGCLPLTYGYIHLLNHEKMCIKSYVEENFVKLATKDQNDEAFLLTSKCLPLPKGKVPMGCLPLPKGYIHV